MPVSENSGHFFMGIQEMTKHPKDLFNQLGSHEAQLAINMRQCIERELDAVGFMPFSRFMELSLYHAEFGYYRNGVIKFGREGDFITAPEVSPLFAACLANQCVDVFSTMSSRVVVEFGAGSGRLAVDLLHALKKNSCEVDRYIIVELSAELQQRQRSLIAREAPDLLPCVTWCQTLPEQCDAVVIANEVLDAMPVEMFEFREDLYQVGVQQRNQTLCWDRRIVAEAPLRETLEQLNLEVDSQYKSEVNLFIKPWIKSIANFLRRGVVLIIDYGFPRREYYHPERCEGTLMCHYRHRSFADPLIMPGLHDITAHVDFTAVAEAADEAQLDVLGYTSQAVFLSNCGLDQMLHAPSVRQQYENAQQVKLLTMPTEMGELFKVMALGKGIDEPLKGFRYYDQLYRL